MTRRLHIIYVYLSYIQSVSFQTKNIWENETYFHYLSENVFPVAVGSTILNIDTKPFTSKVSLFLPRNSPDKAHFVHDCLPYRSVVRSFPLLSPPCLPCWTSKSIANEYIITTGGFLERLYKCIRHNFDEISMYPTPC